MEISLFNDFPSARGKQRIGDGYLQLRRKFPALMSSAEEALTKSKKRKKARGRTNKPEFNKGEDVGILGLCSSGSLSMSISTSDDIPSSTKPAKLPVDFSKLDGLTGSQNQGSKDPTPTLGKRKLKAIKKKERDRTKGPKWFGMTAPEITEERKNDLEALKLRGALDTKTFYKRNTIGVTPKHFQVGRVVENKEDWYSSRLTKKQRKRTMAEELMSEFNS